MNNKIDQVISCECVYFNNIGVLTVKILFKQLIDNSLIKVLYKGEDGKLTIKLFYNKVVVKNFHIFLTKSLVIQKENTQIYFQNGNLNMRFYCQKGLFKNEKLLRKFEELSAISYTTYQKHYNQLNWFEDIEFMYCRNCSNIISHIDQGEKMKIIKNFNYEWEENLELLSCHNCEDFNNVFCSDHFNEKIKNCIIMSEVEIKIPFSISQLRVSPVDPDVLICPNCEYLLGKIETIKNNKFISMSIHNLNYGIKNQNPISLDIFRFVEFLILSSLENKRNNIEIGNCSDSENIRIFIEKNILYESKNREVQDDSTINDFIPYLTIKTKICVDEPKKIENENPIYLLYKDYLELKKEILNRGTEFNFYLNKI